MHAATITASVTVPNHLEPELNKRLTPNPAIIAITMHTTSACLTPAQSALERAKMIRKKPASFETKKKSSHGRS